MADRTAEINVSCQCNRCDKYYQIDFGTGRTIRAGPVQKPSGNKRDSHKN